MLEKDTKDPESSCDHSNPGGPRKSAMKICGLAPHALCPAFPFPPTAWRAWPTALQEEGFHSELQAPIRKDLVLLTFQKRLSRFGKRGGKKNPTQPSSPQSPTKSEMKEDRLSLANKKINKCLKEVSFSFFNLFLQ